MASENSVMLEDGLTFSMKTVQSPCLFVSCHLFPFLRLFMQFCFEIFVFRRTCHSIHTQNVSSTQKKNLTKNTIGLDYIIGRPLVSAITVVISVSVYFFHQFLHFFFVWAEIGCARQNEKKVFSLIKSSLLSYFHFNHIVAFR